MRGKRIKEFVRFLKDNGIFKAFTKSYDPVYYYGGDGRNYTINKYLREVSDEDVITEAFTWANTMQGIEFWSDINKKWEKYAYDYLGGFD